MGFGAFAKDIANKQHKSYPDEIGQKGEWDEDAKGHVGYARGYGDILPETWRERSQKDRYLAVALEEVDRLLDDGFVAKSLHQPFGQMVVDERTTQTPQCTTDK